MFMVWEVVGGVTRPFWARNKNSNATSIEYNKKYK